jgi:FAD/FMN-containing dehydrogenase
VDLTRRTFLIGSAALLVGAEAAEARPLSRAQERALRAAVRGRILTPGDSGYNSARVVFNRRWDARRPPAVVRVRDSADVRAVVRWAERFDIPLVSRSGGHGYNGNSTSDSAVVVDLRQLNGIRYSDGTATIGPGAKTLAIYTALARRGVTIPAGSCPTVALGGSRDTASTTSAGDAEGSIFAATSRSIC